MSDVANQNDGASGAADSAGTAGSTAGATGTVVPEGFVPLADLEREKQRSREFQGRYDALQAERAAAGSAGNGAAGASEGGSPGFDPNEFRTSLLRDVTGTLTMVQAAGAMKAEFPHADPALFTPERLSQFRDPESLRFAADESHRRVASIIASEKQAIEKQIRDELAGNTGSAAGSGGSSSATGDPTPQQLLAMTDAEMDALEAASPGVLKRVMAAAG